MPPRHSADVTRAGAFTFPVNPDAPGKPGTKGPTKLRRRGPQHEAPATPKPTPAKKSTAKAAKAGDDMIGRIRPEAEGLAARRARAPKPAKAVGRAAPHPPDSRPPSVPRPGGKRLREAAQEGHEYAVRQAMRAGTGKPSVTGRAASGAAAGAATGSLGGPVGTVAGGVVGGTAGAISGASAKRAYKRAMRAGTGGARKAVVAEFTICMVIAALSPLTDRRKEEPPGAWMRRMTAIMGVFFVLGLMSAGGRGLSRFAAGFGALVTVALAVSERNLFTSLAGIFGAKSYGTQSMGSAPDPGEDVTLPELGPITVRDRGWET